MRELHELIDDLYDAKSACELAYHDLTPMHRRDRAATQFREAVEAIATYIEALAAATRVRVLDRWTIVGSDDLIAMNYTLSKEISDAWVAVVDKAFPDSAPHRVVRVALVDQNHPEMPESSTRVTDEMVERVARALHEESENPIRGDARIPWWDASPYWHDKMRRMARVALEVPRDQ